MLLDDQPELIDLVVELSRDLSTQMSQRLEEADVEVVDVALLGVHQRDHIDLQWLDSRQPCVTLLRFEEPNALVAIEEQSQELCHCLLLAN